ncbi:MAG: HPr family phosphocarrier protein [Candidatus Odinarchaeota archaeon]|nr:HPr family phosphocarrier protein [Candidatus Odinarchaeota archaeon]
MSCVETRVVLRNKVGLHARPAALFVKNCNEI